MGFTLFNIYFNAVNWQQSKPVSPVCQTCTAPLLSWQGLHQAHLLILKRVMQLNVFVNKNHSFILLSYNKFPQTIWNWHTSYLYTAHNWFNNLNDTKQFSPLCPDPCLSFLALLSPSAGAGGWFCLGNTSYGATISMSSIEWPLGSFRSSLCPKSTVATSHRMAPKNKYEDDATCKNKLYGYPTRYITLW